MAKYFLTNLALDDLTTIWNYTFDEWSEKQAYKYYDSLRFACQEVAENPKFGKAYDSVISNLQGFRTGRHVIFYRELKPDTIEVARILRERIDVNRKL
jgi:toxin ParE1/3/4